MDGEPTGRTLSRLGLAVFLVLAVFPGNVKIALEGGLPGGGWYADPTVAWLRLPLQVPLITWALSHAIERDDDGRWVLPGRSTGAA